MQKKVKTSVQLDEEVLKKIKKLAKKNHRSVSNFIETKMIEVVEKGEQKE